MAIVKWEPHRQLEPLRHMHEEVDKLFDSFFEGGNPFRRGWLSRPVGWDFNVETGFSPVVDLKETEKEYIFTAELPGLTREEVELSVMENAITLKGERKTEEEKKEEKYHCRESFHGTFERTMRLPGEIDASKAAAKMENGVLTLTLPKKEEAKPRTRKIEIE